MIGARRWLVAVVTVGCADGVDVAPEPVADDYTSWHSVESTGDLPGHGDTYRIIYVNQTARGWAGAGAHPVGSTIVKEVHRLADDGEPGELSYIAIMRQLDEAPDGGELHAGWLFTYLAGDIRSTESYRSSCWDTCHAAAPYDGLFLQYGLE
jgi:hypothetical protein